MEKLDTKSMIESIIEDLSNNIDVSLFALKIKLIASKLRNKKFNSWIKNELEGYEKVDELPKHRIEDTEVIANLVISRGLGSIQLTNHVMPLANLQDLETIKELSTIKIMDSVISLEKNNKQNAQIAYMLTEWEKCQIAKIYPNSIIQSVYKTIPENTFEDIIYKFKSTLLEIFIELDNEVFNDELDFDIMAKKHDIAKVVNQTINTQLYFGDQSINTFQDSPITTGNNNTISISIATKEKLESILSQIEEIKIDRDNDKEDIAAELEKIRLELSNTVQQPKILRSAFNAIRGIAVGIAANQITPLVNEALKTIKLK